MEEKQNELALAREEINAVDREMAALFVRRMEAVKRVADYKMRHGLPIYDPAREQAVIDRNSAYVEDAELRSFYTCYLTEGMRISRRYQDKLLYGMKVAFSGVEGAFAAIAAKKIFPTATRMPFGDFRAAYDAVVDGRCDCAVLPIENSTAGEVGAVLDMLYAGPLHLTGVYDLYIHQNLMALPGTRREDITRVISHPQALAQCAPYLRDHGYTTEAFENTALAAKHVAEAGDRTLAAIASEETAEIYGLEILEKKINEKSINTTRFAVLTREALSGDGDKGRHSILDRKSVV